MKLIPYEIIGIDSQTGRNYIVIRDISTYEEAQNIANREVRPGNSDQITVRPQEETLGEYQYSGHPDIRGGIVTSTVVEQEGKYVPYTESEQYKREQLAQQQLVNIEKAIQERPQIVGIRETLQKQVQQQAQGFFGERQVNLTPAEIIKQAEAEKIAGKASEELLYTPALYTPAKFAYSLETQKGEIPATSFTYKKPTTQEQKYTPSGLISARKEEVSRITPAEKKLYETSYKAMQGSTIASLSLGFLKAGKELPKAGLFGLASAVAPKITGIFAIATTPFFIKPFQESISTIGLKRTILEEVPTFSLYGAGAKFGLGVRAKTIQTYKNILLNREFLKTGKEVIPFEELPREITTPPGTAVRQEFLVKELKGTESLFDIREEGFGVKGAAIQKPIFAPPEYVKTPKVPDLILATAEETLGRTTKKVYGKETQIPQKVEELADIQTKQRLQRVLTPEEARQYAVPKQKVAFVGGMPISTLRTDIIGTSNIFFQPIEAKGGTLAVIPTPTPRGKPSGIKYIEGIAKPQIGVEYKLPNYATEPILQLQRGRLLTSYIKTPEGKIIKTTQLLESQKPIPISKPVQPKPTPLEKPVSAGRQQLIQILEQPKQKAKVISKQKPVVESWISAKQEYPFIETIEEPLSRAAQERVGLFYAERGTAKVKVTPTPSSVLGLRVSALALVAQRPAQAQAQNILQAPRQIPATKAIQKPAITPMQFVGQLLAQKPVQEVRQVPKQKPMQNVFLAPAQVPAQIPIQTLAQVPAQIPRQDVFQDLLQQQKPITDLFKLTPPKTPPTTTIGRKRKLIEKLKERVSEMQGYDVFIKAKQEKLGKGKYRGKGFTKANQVPLTRESALGMGADIVDTWANRSFTIRKSSKSGQRVGELMQRWQTLKEKFRVQKKNPNVMVEKSAFAIDNPMEVKQIPYEAIRQRKKRAMQNLLVVARKKHKIRNINFLSTKKKQNKKHMRKPKWI